MFDTIRSHPSALVLAILIHLMLVAMLSFSLDWSAKKPERIKSIIQATAVNQADVLKEIENINATKDKQKQQQANELKKLKKEIKRVKAEKKAQQRAVQKVKRDAKQQIKKLSQIKSKQQREIKQLSLKQQDDQKKKLAEIKKQLAEEEKRLITLRLESNRQKQDIEIVKKQTAELKKKQQKEHQRLAKLKEDAEKKRKKQAQEALEKKIRFKAEQDVREKALQAQLASEQQLKDDKEISRYLAIINEKIRRNFLVPGGTSKDLICSLEIKLIPGGEVINVKILKSSGSSAYDQAVKIAVARASPLPVPPNNKLFDRFRKLKLNFTP